MYSLAFIFTISALLFFVLFALGHFVFVLVKSFPLVNIVTDMDKKKKIAWPNQLFINVIHSNHA